MSPTDHDARKRVITEVTFKYRYEDDAGKEIHEARLWHESEGEYIDGIIWNEGLMEKIRYWEDGAHTNPSKGRGNGQWKTDLKHAHAPAGGARIADARTSHCFWLHDHSCMWWSYCGPPEER